MKLQRDIKLSVSEKLQLHFLPDTALLCATYYHYNCCYFKPRVEPWASGETGEGNREKWKKKKEKEERKKREAENS